MLQYFHKKYGLAKDKMLVAPNASALSPGRNSKKSFSGQHIVYAGILEPWENVQLLIKSFAHFSPLNPKSKN
jgi:hypothetical protein